VVKELYRQLQVRGAMKFYTKQKISSGETLDAFVTASLVMRNRRVLLQLVTVDVTARLRTERALQEAEKRFRGTFEQFAVGIAHVAPDGTYLRVNRKYRQILGYSEPELRHLSLVNISHPNDIDADWAQANALLEGEISTYAIEKRLIRKGGSVVWVNLTVSLVRSESGEAEYFISVVEDITARKRAESERDELLRNLEQQVSQRTAELERVSLTDALTGIPNRRHLDKALAAEWARAARSKRPLSLVLLDIDDFKVLNDSFGHVQGDRVIKAVASTVQQVASRSSDLGARYGGDEFAMLLPETEAAGAQRLAERLRLILNNFSFTDPVRAGQLKVTVSQGIAAAAGSSQKSATDLLLAADKALYAAKKQGRGYISTVSQL
jgi:diguanylate cyclase (GGDEF)-like protein/PAS domain S-box-containing protein